MKPPRFEYHRVASVPEAVEILERAGGDGKILAGGQSLVPMLNFRLVSPAVLVDLNGVRELQYIKRTDGVVRMGAMTRTRQLETDGMILRDLPLLRAAAGWVGHVQIRNRGTVGGSLAHADPAAELPAMALLFDASLDVTGPRGDRRVSAADFFQGYFTTALAENEVLTEIVWPVPSPDARWGFAEFAPRHGDFALAGVACLLELDGAVRRARLVCFGLGEVPFRVPAGERRLEAGGVSGDAIAAVVTDVLAAAEAVDDARTDAAHRRRLLGELTRDVLGQALGRTAA